MTKTRLKENLPMKEKAAEKHKSDVELVHEAVKRFKSNAQWIANEIDRGEVLCANTCKKILAQFCEEFEDLSEEYFDAASEVSDYTFCKYQRAGESLAKINEEFSKKPVAEFEVVNFKEEKK